MEDDEEDLSLPLAEAIRAGTAKVMECFTLGRPRDAEEYASVTRELCAAMRELTEAAVIAQAEGE